MFLRRIAPGGADRSYGVHVARLAGLPGSVVNRAWDILGELEGDGPSRDGSESSGRPTPPPPEQLRLLGPDPAVIDELLSYDIASLTPLEAITRLYELQERARRLLNLPTADHLSIGKAACVCKDRPLHL